MSKSIKISESQWLLLRAQLKKEHPPSVMLTREKMRRVLGFTTRSHREWKVEDGPGGMYDGHGQYQYTMFLDFFDEKKKTFFLLRYGNFISTEENSDK